MPFVASLMLLSLGFAMIEVCRKYCLLFGDFSEYPLYPKFISFIFPHIGKKQLNLMKIRTFCFFLQTQSGSGGLVVSSDEKKREELRWFPADNISDCDAEPGLEQVRLTAYQHKTIC